MSTFEAIVLGIVQGLTEFLPISSTGHLRIIPAFVGWDDPGSAFTAVIQLGTTAAVLIYFREDLWRIGRAWFASLRAGGARHSQDARLGWYIVLGTIPIGIFGLAFKHDIEHGARSLYLIGTVLIVFGLVMLAADRTARQTRDTEDMTPRDGILVGLAQALALVPGVSRSGATISAGLFAGLTRESAARYSFLLSTPAIVLAALLELKGIVDGSEHTGASTSDLLVATFFAFVVGYWSISFLLRFITRHGLVPFVVYRVLLGALVLALTAGGAIS
ncbi:MAG: undecaprenyl-diphosphatase [Thermoleophilaceae bacterium]|nr:undecaprenyl-diphosphatase [Thermoleophilaceae bacterium]